MAENTINKVFLRGFVKKEPTIRYFSDTNVKAYFPLITFDVYKSQTETRQIQEFHNIVAWKEIARKVEEQIKENQLVEVTGRLKTSTYEKNGEQKLSVQIVISDFEIIQDVSTAKSEATYPPTIEETTLDNLGAEFDSDEDEDSLPF